MIRPSQQFRPSQIESAMGVGELYERVTAVPCKEWLKKTAKPSSLKNMLTDQRLERPLQKREARIARDAAIDGMSYSRLDQLKVTSDTNGRVTATDPVNTAVSDLQPESTRRNFNHTYPKPEFNPKD